MSATSFPCLATDANLHFTGFKHCWPTENSKKSAEMRCKLTSIEEKKEKRIRNPPTTRMSELKFQSVSHCSNPLLYLFHIFDFLSSLEEKFPPRNSHSSRNRLSEVRFFFRVCMFFIRGENLAHSQFFFLEFLHLLLLASPFSNLIAWRESEGISRVIK